MSDVALPDIRAALDSSGDLACEPDNARRLGVDVGQPLLKVRVSDSGQVLLAPQPQTAPDAAVEIASLDDLWVHEWNAPPERSVGVQRLAELHAPSTAARCARRFLDIVVALVVLLLALPLMIAVAVAVRATTSGGAMFRHRRVGRDGEIFDVLKFRSMVDGTHDAVIGDDDAMRDYEANDFKLDAEDPRITSVGKFIRKTSLDELPQLFNVLRGDMSIVGIRPLESIQLETRSVYDQQLYKTMRPGLTGLWQVEGRAAIGAEVRVALDRTYVQQWSVIGDVIIMLRTPLALVRTAGAY